MVTLANINGASLVPQVQNALRQDIGGAQDRTRENEAKSALAENLRIAMGGAPTDAKPSKGLGVLGQLAPDLAKAASALIGNRDPQATESFRNEATQGKALSKTIQAAPSFSAKQRLLADEVGKVAGRGGDVSRLVALSNLNEDQLGLELQKMQVVADGMLKAVPAVRGGESLNFFSNDRRRNAFAEVAASNPRMANSLLASRDRQSGRSQQQSNADRAFELQERNIDSQIAARDAKAAAPQGIPEQMGFSKEQTGRFNAAISLGATEDQAVSEAVSTSSERTKNVKVDQAIKSLNKGLDRFEETVIGVPATKGRKATEGTGAIVNPFGAEAQSVQTMRRGIQLQLKELFDLGVLNGPDLELLDQVLFDPQFSLNPVGDTGVNVPINAAERTKASVREIKKIIGDIRAGKRLPSQFGQQEASQPSPQTNPAITRAEALNDIRGVPQTATNPQTGERIQFNPQTGQWEPIS